MALEVPLIALAEQMVDSVNDLSCEQVYTEKFQLTNYAQLCAPTSQFNFADPFKSAFALTNIYLYTDTFNPQIVDDFLTQTSMDMTTMKNIFSNPQSATASFMRSLMVSLKHDLNIEECNAASLSHSMSLCSFSFLTNTQWLNGQILKRTSQEMEMGQKPVGYVEAYEGYSQLPASPEWGHWFAYNEFLPQTEPTLDTAYSSLNLNDLFNNIKLQDSLLKQQGATVYDHLDEYLRFITINMGLSGVLTKRSPREMIEGYTDPLVEELNQMPIYMGGDQATSPVLALDNPPTHPVPNRITFFTGEDDHSRTRSYASWLENPSITMQIKEYETINKLKESQISPWPEKVPLKGTDGMQFQTSLTKEDTIAAFVNDLSRSCEFSYTDTNKDYKGLDTYMFTIEESLMLNKTANPLNEIYDVRITGTSNMTTTLNAWSFVAKGHYYQLSEEASESKPIIRDQQGQEIVADPQSDETFLGVEQLSGVCLIAKERIFYNFAVYKDELFKDWSAIPSNSDHGLFMPLLYVKRESEWSQDQVDEAFGALVLGKKLKWVIFGLFLVAGVICLILAAMMLYRLCPF